VPDWLLSPTLALSIFLALVYTLAVHLVLGLGYKHLLRHWLLALAAMAAGYLIAARANTRLPTLGDAHVIEASLAAVLVLLAAGLRGRSLTRDL
jgi:hypothetical protein